LAWTWAFWWAAALSGRPWSDPLVGLAYVLGALGPLGTALALVAAGHTDLGAAAFLRRSFDPRTAPARAWVAAGALLAVAVVAPRLVIAVRDGAAPGPWLDPSAPATFLLVGALAGMVEEPGWRGYAQLGLQRRLPVLASALAVGAVWAVWHLPLFFLSGTYQASLGIGTPAFWSFFAAILLASPVYAWLLASADGAPVVAVAYHAAGNVSAELFAMAGAGGVELAVQAAVTLAVVALGARTLLRRRHDPL